MPRKSQTVRTALNKARKLLSTNPVEARTIVEEVLASVDGYPTLKADSLGMLGLSRQFSGDRRGALNAFHQALALEKRDLERGSLLCQLAILEVEWHHFSQALRHSCLGHTLIAKSNPPHREMAQGLISRGICYWHNDKLEESEADNKKALQLYINPRRDPKLHYDAVNNLALCYIYGQGGLERVERALEVLYTSERLLRRHKVPVKSIQGGMLLWTRGIVLRTIGAEERAEHLYIAAQSSFEATGALTEWLRVSLDLAEIYLHHGLWNKCQALVAEMLLANADTETLAALALLQSSLKRQRVTSVELQRAYTNIHDYRRKAPMLRTQPERPNEPIGF